MLRLGVVRPDQFYPSAPKQLLPYIYYRLSRGRVSLQLLRTDDEDTFERLMTHVRLSNGVHRTTFRNRFRNLDPLVNRVLTQIFSKSDELTVEDWAASACFTSCEWAETLFPLFPNARLTASDLVLFLIEIRNTRSGEVFIAEQEGRPLQYVHGSLVIRMEPAESWSAPINRFWYEHAKMRSRAVANIWPLPAEWLELRAGETLERPPYVLRKLPLVHPRALDLARRDARFAIRRHSAFEAAPGQSHVIRTMNILNRAYFSEEQLAASARSVSVSLHPGGVWIVGRTTQEDPPLHTVSILQKEDSGRLRVLERVGEGSEIESLALDAVGRES